MDAKTPDTVGVGLCMLDELLLLPRYPDPAEETAIHVLGSTRQGGGPAATAMAAAARLGASAGIVGGIGDDDRGRQIAAGLAAAGVDTSRLLVRAGVRSDLSVVCVHAPTGRRSFLIDSDPAVRLSPADLDREYVAAARVVLIDGFGPAALAAAGCARQAGRTVVLDAAGCPPDRDALEAVLAATDVAIGSAAFGRGLIGRDDPAAAADAARALGPATAVVTGGADGAWAASPEGRFHQPAFDVDVVDTTGAGDVFHGAFIVGLLEGRPLRGTTAFAAAVAAMSCRALGGRAGIPTRQEALDFLAARAGTD